MHDTVRVAVVKGHHQLIEVYPNIPLLQSRNQQLGLHRRHILIDEAGGLRDLVSQDIIEFDNVGPSEQRLQDFDLPVNLLSFNRLEYLDDALLAIVDIDTLVHLRVLAPSEFVQALVVGDLAPANGQLAIEAVVRWPR